MSSDGCKEVAWAGQAFPFAPSAIRPSGIVQNYGDLRRAQPKEPAFDKPSPSSDVHTRAASGTWMGPAPQGFRGSATFASDVEKLKNMPTKGLDEPKDTLIGSARIPMLALATDGTTTAEQVATALAAGFKWIDVTRESEAIVAKALDLSDRKSLTISSRLPVDARSPDAVRSCVETTIKTLGCEYLDLCVIEWAVTPDASLSLKDTYAAVEALVKDGKVRAIALAHWGLTKVEDALGFAEVKPVMNAIELHPACSQRKLLGVSRRKGVESVALAPTAGGAPALLGHSAVVEVAKITGKTPAQVCLKWNTQRGVPVMVPAGSEGLVDAVALFDWKLSDYCKVLLDKMDMGMRTIDALAGCEWEDAEAGGAAKPSRVFNY